MYCVTFHRFIQALEHSRRVVSAEDPAVHYGGARWSFKLWGLFNVSGNFNAGFVDLCKPVTEQQRSESLPLGSSHVVLFILHVIRWMSDPPDQITNAHTVCALQEFKEPDWKLAACGLRHSQVSWWTYVTSVL